jgi:hypothetical protein
MTLTMIRGILTNPFKLSCGQIAPKTTRCHLNAPFRQCLFSTMSDSSRSDFAAQPKREKIKSLRDTITFKQPVVFGTSPFPADQWTLFYGEKGQLG